MAAILPPLLTICLPLGLPILSCPPAPPEPSAEPRPVASTPTTVRYDAREIIVRFRRRTEASAIDAAFERAEVSVERRLPRTQLYVVQAREGKRGEALESLRREKAVDRAQRELIVNGLDTTPNDAAWADQWGLRTTGFPRAWDVTRGSKTVVVAVLDTGVDGSHPDLRGALVPGRDIVNADNDPADDNGHGTAVAGIVAARTDNKIGIAGACWECALMPVKVLGADGTGTTGDVAAGIIWAVDHGARVINLSLGSPGTTDALTQAIDYAASKDVVLVSAAGNSATSIPFYPAADGAVIGVGGTNQNDALYSWSNRGSWVQVAAPGCNDALWPGGGYVSFCGTSAAAPLVAGLAGLIRSARPTATALETAGAVYDAVDQMAGEIRRGRVNAGNALIGLRAPDAGAAGRRAKTSTLRGRLGHGVRSRRIARRVGAGTFRAVVRFTGARRLSLLLIRPDRPRLRVAGASPLRLTQAVTTGPVTIIVRGSDARASYRLQLSYSIP